MMSRKPASAIADSEKRSDEGTRIWEEVSDSEFSRATTHKTLPLDSERLSRTVRWTLGSRDTKLVRML